MRPVYVRKLFELLKWLEMPQHAIARQLNTTESNVSMWATGQRAIPKRHRDAFIELTGDAIAHLWNMLKPTLLAELAPTEQNNPLIQGALAHGPCCTDEEFSALGIGWYVNEHSRPSDAWRQAFEQLRYVRECLQDWDLEVAEGDGSLYHELAEALRTLRPYIFMNEEELRLATTPEARQELWKAFTTGTWCMRTLDALGPVPEVEQLRQRFAAPVQQDGPSSPVPEKPSKIPAGSHSGR